MSLETSVIMCALNQGDWVRRTVPHVRRSIANITHEIIVVDDHSVDGCCDGLDDVTVIKPKKRLGVSGARRFAVEHAKYDTLLFSDPHCWYPDTALKQLVKEANRKQAIIQTATISPKPEFDPEKTPPTGGRHRVRYGGRLLVCERGLRIKHCWEPAEHPALLGTIYCVRRELYNFLGGWPHLPGVWGYSEQALSLAAWFAGVPIYVDPRNVCVHYDYHPITNGKQHFAYRVRLEDQASNGHWIHAAFFPQTYHNYWQAILKTEFGDKPSHIAPLKSERFVQFQRQIHRSAVRSEKDFFEMVLGSRVPELPDAQYVKQQSKKSKPQDYPGMLPRVHRAIDWFIKQIPGCIRGRTVIDLGTRDGGALEYFKKRGARHVEGVELVPETVRFAVKEKKRNVRVGDMRGLADPANHWDVVSSIHSLEHVPEPEKARDEMIRICKPGGWILLVIPVEESPVVLHAHNASWPNIDLFRSFILASSGLDPATVHADTAPLHGGKREIRLCVQKKRGAA